MKIDFVGQVWTLIFKFRSMLVKFLFLFGMFSTLALKQIRQAPILTLKKIPVNVFNLNNPVQKFGCLPFEFKKLALKFQNQRITEDSLLSNKLST